MFVPQRPPSPGSLNAISLKPQWIGRSSSSHTEVSETAKNQQSIVSGFAALRLNRHSSEEKVSSVPPKIESVQSSTDTLAVTSSILNLSKDDLPFEDGEKISSLEARVRACALYTINAVIEVRFFNS